MSENKNLNILRIIQYYLLLLFKNYFYSVIKVFPVIDKTLANSIQYLGDV